MIGIRVIGDDLLAAGLRGHAATIPGRVDASARHHRQLLLTRIQAGMTKRTGRMAASYHLDGDSVGSDHPGARRHEMGFHGTDARGAVRSDPPHPVVGPAADEIGDRYVQAVDRLAEI